ncbi:hypothetical protein DFQ28_011273 [Apophysomyces sp. BC1034]|nr:hypothetical protein DFQ29_008949 [Apophysomyces sp. BC1021]KAG0191673.1 hypothetical protein DFQ28_011273 [Apophysomyces sp. BC1034]
MLAAFIKLKDCMQCMRQVLEIIENGRIWFGQDFRSAIAPLMEIICRSRQNVTPLPVMRQVSQPTAEIIKLEHHPACYVPPVISWSSKDPQVPVTLTGNSSKIFIPTVSGQLLSPPEAPMPVTVCCPETPRVSIVSDPSQESFSSPTSAFVHPSVTHSVSTPSPEPTPSVSSTQCTTSGRTSEEELEDNSNTDNEDEELLAIDDQHDEDYRESSEDEEEEDDESGDLTWQEPTEQSRYDRLRSGEGTQQKCRRRTATSYDTETTHYLKSVFFKIYSKHEKLTKEQRLQVQRHTGLKPRNITYWFSNHKRRFQGTLEVYRQTVKQSGGQVKTYDDFLNWRSIHGFPKEMEEDST